MTTYAWVTEHGEQPLSVSDLKELKRLRAKHRDIWTDGAGALVKEAEKQAKLDRQQEWVESNGLSCFDCGATATTWAKGGRRKNGSLYVICLTCVRKPK